MFLDFEDGGGGMGNSPPPEGLAWSEVLGKETLEVEVPTGSPVGRATGKGHWEPGGKHNGPVGNGSASERSERSCTLEVPGEFALS